MKMKLLNLYEVPNIDSIDWYKVKNEFNRITRNTHKNYVYYKIRKVYIDDEFIELFYKYGIVRVKRWIK